MLDQPLRFNDLVLDPASQTMAYQDRTVHLSSTEMRMLAAVVARPGEVVRRRSVVAAAWPDGAIVHANTIDSFIRRIRVKLAELGSPVVLQTVRGVGFTVR